ncbi:MAG: hypothetical protein WCD76_13365 [Pyrinomonadaceae bacterium]
MSDYATSEQLTGYLPRVTSEADLATLAGMLTRASRAIDAFTRRHADAFAPAEEEASEQVFYGEGQPVLILPEFVTGSVSTVTAPSSYMPEGFTEFRRREASTGTLRVGLHTATAEGVRPPRVGWAKGVPFTVTATWGFEAIPADVTEACLQLVTRWWRAKDEAFAGVIGDISQQRAILERGFPPGVKTLLEPYVLADVETEQEEGGIERGDLLNSDFNPHGGGGWGRF